MRKLKRFWYTLLMQEAIIQNEVLTYRWAKLMKFKNRKL